MPDINESLAAGSPFVYRLIQKTQHNSHTYLINIHHTQHSDSIFSIPPLISAHISWGCPAYSTTADINVGILSLTNPITVGKCVGKQSTATLPCRRGQKLAPISLAFPPTK